MVYSPPQVKWHIQINLRRSWPWSLDESITGILSSAGLTGWTVPDNIDICHYVTWYRFCPQWFIDIKQMTGLRLPSFLCWHRSYWRYTAHIMAYTPHIQFDQISWASVSCFGRSGDLEPWLSQINYLKIDTCCFRARYSALLGYGMNYLSG